MCSCIRYLLSLLSVLASCWHHGTREPECIVEALLKSQIARRQMQQGHMGYDRPETPLLLKTATSGCLIKTSKSCMVLYGIRSLLALSACIACVNMHTTFHSTRCGVAAQDWQQLQPVYLLRMGASMYVFWACRVSCTPLTGTVKPQRMSKCNIAHLKYC